jgi:hypothetical protein
MLLAAALAAVLLTLTVLAVGDVARTMGFLGDPCVKPMREHAAAMGAEAESLREVFGSEKVSEVYCDDSDGSPFVVFSPPAAKQGASVVDLLSARGWRCRDAGLDGFTACTADVDGHRFRIGIEVMADRSIDIELGVRR